MRYPVVLLDVGETLIRPCVSFGEVYASVFRELRLDLPGELFERCLREVWEATSARIPAGVDRYNHEPGGDDAYWLRFAGETLKRATGRPADPELTARALPRLREAFGRASSWSVHDDVVPSLEALAGAGVRLATVSNWDSRLPLLMETLGLARYFEVIGVSSIEGVEKPAPEFFLRVLERLEAAPQQALHVGDVPELDLDGARAAGLDGLLVDRRGRLGGRFRPVPDLSGLPRIAAEGLGRGD